MATGSGGKSGTTRKRTSASGRTTGTGTRKRTTSKPLIIDVEADAVAKSGAAASPSPKPSAKSTGKTVERSAEKPGGLDDKTAQAAGLSAAPASQSTSASTKAATPSRNTQEPVEPIVPPNATDGGGTPSPFYLFSAGLIGALLALVLMFLATLAGLFSLPDGRVDGQALALRALEERLQVVEAQDSANGPGFDIALLEPLEMDIAALRSDLESGLVDVGDAAPQDVDAAVSAVLGPLDARLAAVESELQAALDTLSAALDGGAAPAVVETADPALTADVEGVRADLVDVRAELEGLQGTLRDIESQLDAVPPETGARLNALDGLVADTDNQIGAFGQQVRALLGDVEMLGLRMSTLDEGLNALAEAPVVQAPDRLARLGVVLDALVTARDAGTDIAAPLAAAQAAASFDGQLADALTPLSSTQVSGALSDAAVLAAYEEVYDAMRAAAPASEGGGLLGALEERARQMVTIRAPEGAALSGGASPAAQLDLLGSLIAAGRFEEGLALATDLPVAMQQASGSLVETLNARIALDDAITNARQALMAQLSVPASDANSQ